MAKNTVPRGETSVIRHVFIMDSTSTAGAGKTGLAYNTASLTAYYLYPGGTAGALTLETISTLGTYAAPTSNAHLRFKEVDATNMPGWYELHFHNDWFSVASGRKAACLQLKGATGMAPLNLEIDCIGAAIQDTLLPVNTTQISGDATAADNLEAACDGTTYNIGGGAVVAASVTGAVGSVTGAVGSVTGAVGSVTGAVGSVTAGVTVTTNNDKTGYSLTATTGLGNQTANITGNLSGSVGSVTGAVGSVVGAVGSVTGAVGSISGVTFPTNFADLNISLTTGLVRPDMANASGNYAGTVATVTTLTNLPAITTNWLTAAGLAADAVTEIQAGLATAANLATVAGYLDTEVAAILAAVDTEVGAIKTVTDAIGATGTGLSSVPWNAAWDVEVQSECTDALTAWGKTGFSLAAAGLDAIVIETGMNARQAMAVIAAAVAGILSGAATATVTIKAAQEGSITRVTATVDADGNRSAVTLNLPT